MNWTYKLINCVLILSVIFGLISANKQTRTRTDTGKFEIDKNGYIWFCLCMGRFGNQAEHFLGGLAFAKSIDRTLVIPAFRNYKNVEYEEWFLEKSLIAYHRVISGKDFMKHVAPVIWPPEKRKGFCFAFPNKDPCDMVTGNKHHGAFWTEYGVEFVDTVQYSITYQNPEPWSSHFSASQYPVIALKGAPGGFPMNPNHIPLQKYMDFSDNLMKEAEGLLKRDFGSSARDYVAVHLRHGSDWVNACARFKDGSTDELPAKFMSSYQCQGTDYKNPLTYEMCIPSQQTVMDLVKRVVQMEGVKKLLIATDKLSWVEEFKQALGPEVRVVHPDPHNPLVDIVLLSEARHFIGNCVSSFTAFVWRQRNTHNKGKTSHFAHTIVS